MEQPERGKETRKIVSGLMLALLLTSILILALNIQPVREIEPRQVRRENNG